MGGKTVLEIPCHFAIAPSSNLIKCFCSHWLPYLRPYRFSKAALNEAILIFPWFLHMAQMRTQMTLNHSYVNLFTTRKRQDLPPRPMAMIRIRGHCPTQIFLLLQNFVVPRKICLTYNQNKNLVPLKMYFAPKL